MNNHIDNRVCPEFRPLMAQANAGEGRFQQGHNLEEGKSYGPVEFTPTCDQDGGRRWYQLRQPKGQWKRADDEQGGKSLHEIGGYQPSHAPEPELDEPPIDSDMFETAATFQALLDRFERMCQLQEARAIKHAPHPTRERLLEAVRWALGEDDHHSAKEFEPGEMFRARLRRLAGL